LVLLTAAVMAQQPDADLLQVGPSIEPLETLVSQAVPVTLTVNVPGPDGMQIVEIPVVINLDILIGISSELTTSVQATTTVLIPDAPPGEGGTAEKDPAPVPSTPTPTATAAATAAAPTATSAPVATAAPTATATPTELAVVAPLCPDPRAVIASPGVGQVISGTINITGTATHENFDYYKVEYAQGTDVDPGEEFAFLANFGTPVENGQLAVFGGEDFDPGAYTLKLTVVDRTGNFPPPCTVTVMVEN
jgi:hypothetical protein